MSRSATATVIRWFAAASLWAALAAAHAQCDPRYACCTTPPPGGTPVCGQGGPAQQPATVPTAPAGNPLDVMSGNKHQREVDLPALPGVLGLELVRHYNSALAQRGLVLGRGWRLSYQTELRVGEAGLTLVQADGATLSFARGVIEPDRFSHVDPLRGSVLRHFTAMREPFYVWRWPDGRELHFDARGNLTSINAPTGEAVLFVHAPDGKLVRVRDPQGRELGLLYDKLGRIDAIDSPVGRFRYAYEGNSARLVRATLPGEPSVTRRYHYEDARHPDLLTGISVESAGSDGKPTSLRLAAWGYDERGWAVSSVKGDGQDNVERVSVQRKALAGGAGEATLTNSLGHTTVYRWRTIARQPRLVEVLGPGCASCGETNVRYGYDKLGRLVDTTQLDDRGQPMLTTRHTLDSVGRVARTEQAAYRDGRAQPPRLLTRYEYPLPPATVPSLVARPSVIPGKEHTLRIAYNQAGQPTRVTEQGFSPVDDQGAPSPAGTPISRTTTYGYSRIRQRSLLVQVDGPLPDGVKGTPEDSDIIRFGWDESGSRVTSMTLPLRGATRIEYDEQGRVGKVTGPGGQADVYAYRADGQPTSILHHDAEQATGTAWRHDALGRIVEALALVGDARTPQAAQGFDPAGRLLWQASALGVLVQQRLDSEGRVLEIGRYSNRMAQVQRFEHDAQGRVTRIAQPGGAALSISYDTRGRALAATDALGRKRRLPAPQGTPPARTLHDDFGRAVLTISPDSGTTLRLFDPADRLVGSRDANGNRAVYEHDAAGRILRQRISDPRSGHTVETAWVYEGSRLVGIRHPTQSEQYEFDERGRRSGRVVRPAGPGGGEVAHSTHYERDARGMLHSSTLPDGSVLRYRRNGQGQVVALERERIRTPWLRWLLPPQTIVRDIERDLVGPWRYVAGNGMETRHERSREGVLSRVVVRRSHVGARAVASAGRLSDLLGVTPSHAGSLAAIAAAAAPAGPPGSAATAITTAPATAAVAAAASNAAAPGALGLPLDAQALIDHRYLWDAQGNLLQLHSKAGTPARADFAYDPQDRLAVSVREQERAGVSRYLYDAAGRRLLSQQGAGSQHDLVAHTRRATYGQRTHRWLGAPPQGASYAADGTPTRIGNRDFTWDALGRLTEVKEEGRSLARYAYSHRGERIGKTAAGQHTGYLYEGGQLAAELDAQGRISRQYLYLADMPAAVIDTPNGKPLARADDGAWARLVDDLGTVVAAWFDRGETLVWLHANHLGAVEAATDEAAQVIWRAAYEPFGEARVTQAAGFALNLRLPGQYADAETGLHYNVARYYDPQRGEYLSPDPLGTPDGPNPYAYVRGNPLRYVDPAGLALFAFDGTDNSRDPRELRRLGGSLTNVARFVRLYRDGLAEYVSGVGTQHFEDGRTNYLHETYDPIMPRGFGPIPDRGGNYTGRERIDRMWSYLIDDAELHPDSQVLDIDIVGFSRGAAQAREFANRVANATFVQNGHRYLRYTALDEVTRQELQRCQPVNLRFMGLFDTVLSTDLGGGPDYHFGIPGAFAHVAHAVALNEYRSQRFASDILGYPFNAAMWNETRRRLPESLHQGGFPLISIGESSYAPGHVRIERGFIGAHADIGGGYPQGENQLSFVALNWMVEQALQAGVNMNVSGVDQVPVGNPVLHDQSNALRMGDPRNTPLVPIQVQGGDGTYTEWINLRAEDRLVRGSVSGDTQRQMEFTAFGPGDRSLTNAETHAMIDYTSRPVTGNPVDTWNALNGNQTGHVDIQTYMSWLCTHGYFSPTHSQCATQGGTP